MKGILIFIIICVILICLMILWGIHDIQEMDRACKEIEFENYKFINRMEYCEDSEGNLHYIKIECNNWWWFDCKAKTISVGNVRIK